MNIIGKIDLEKVAKVPKYTIKELQNDVLKLLSERDYSLDYQTFLKQILHKYKNLLKEKDCIDGIFYRVIEKEIQSVTDRIERILTYYLQGKISSSYNVLGRWWNGEKGLGFRLDAVSYNIGQGKILFRMRRKEGNGKFSAKDMFHVPYSSRHLLKNYRYSITGFPCLYLGKSIYGCWEEMGKPSFNDFYVSALKTNTDISLLDLRLVRDVEPNEESRSAYLSSLPIIIACSIENLNGKASFVPEYIIPQMMLHAILLEKSNERGFEGVIYTSTKCISAPNLFNNLELFSNIAIPVKGHTQDKGLCSDLKGKFIITKPISAEYVFLRSTNVKKEKESINYQSTTFGILEEELSRKKFEEISE